MTDVFALDTNIIVRILTNDDSSEADRARRLVSDHEVFVGETVLLEAAWVLGNRYGLAPRRIAQLLRGFVGLPTVNVETPPQLDQALSWAEQGADIADAFHLAAGREHGSFASFDRDLLRFARARDVAVVEP